MPDARAMALIPGDQQIQRVGTGENSQVRPMTGRPQIGPRRAVPPAGVLGRLRQTDPLGYTDIVILDPRHATRDQRRHDGAARGIGFLETANPHRPIGATRRMRRPRPALGAPEIGQHVVPAPAGIAGGDPARVIRRQATAIDHAIDRA
jgi:hypothetical protein